MPEVIDIIVLDENVPDARPQRTPRRTPFVVGALVVAALVTIAGVVSVSKPGWKAKTAGAGDKAVVAAAARAMHGWARFATVGEPDDVALVFDRRGPQFAQLSSEAPAIRARHDTGPPYVFELHDPHVVVSRSTVERTVRAAVVVRRLGEEDQHFAWDIVLRRHGGRWIAWTIRDDAPRVGRQ